MPEVRFNSGGTAPTAFNPRTAAALKEIGVAIEPIGKEGSRGEPKTANPIYRVKWGETSAAGTPMETVEFSKLYSDQANPPHDFAALMVCSEADAACPFVRGASIRISMPYLDPKIFDDSPYEREQYRERRDDMGRLMLSVLIQARAQLATETLTGKTSDRAP
jgi:arsenate reductase